jgi:hypothetical protein
MSTRRQVRDALAELARAHIPDAQRIYPLTNDDGERVTQPFDFSGESPVIVIASSGTERGQKTFRGAMPTYYLDVHLLVRATSIDDSGNTVGVADLDDTLDGLEHAVGTLIAAVQNGEHWTAIDYDGRSRAEFLSILDGTEYKREIISLKITARL